MPGFAPVVPHVGPRYCDTLALDRSNQSPSGISSAGGKASAGCSTIPSTLPFQAKHPHHVGHCGPPPTQIIYEVRRERS